MHSIKVVQVTVHSEISSLKRNVRERKLKKKKFFLIGNQVANSSFSAKRLPKSKIPSCQSPMLRVRRFRTWTQETSVLLHSYLHSQLHRTSWEKLGEGDNTPATKGTSARRNDYYGLQPRSPGRVCSVVLAPWWAPRSAVSGLRQEYL